MRSLRYPSAVERQLSSSCCVAVVARLHTAAALHFAPSRHSHTRHPVLPRPATVQPPRHSPRQHIMPVRNHSRITRTPVWITLWRFGITFLTPTSSLGLNVRSRCRQKAPERFHTGPESLDHQSIAFRSTPLCDHRCRRPPACPSRPDQASAGEVARSDGSTSVENSVEAEDKSFDIY